jgi:hypothetical protein
LRPGTVALKYASLVEFAKVWRISMGDYEIRILKTDGKPSLVYACSHMSDAGAIRSARNIAREPGDRIEVWRGMSCIHREDGLQLPLARRPPGNLPTLPSSGRAISIG